MVNKKPIHLFPIFLILLFVTYFLKDILPMNLAAENSLIENLQLIILLIGACICYYFARHTNKTSDKYIWSGGIAFFIILCLREISWGRTLLMHPNGTIPSWEELGFYGQIIHPLVAVFITGTVYLFYKGNFFQFLRTLKIPVCDLAILFLLIIMATVAEKGSFAFFHGEMAEELSESLLYCEMCYISLQVGISKQNPK